MWILQEGGLLPNLLVMPCGIYRASATSSLNPANFYPWGHLRSSVYVEGITCSKSYGMPQTGWNDNMKLA
jgi:hypothetical protein